jgi:peptidoglycan hydrolase CwlO-like protein
VSREQGRTSTPVRQGSEQDLQNQIRDLSNSNTELREQLDEQKAKMKDLTDDMNRLRLELDQTKTGKPPVRKNPTP